MENVLSPEIAYTPNPFLETEQERKEAHQLLEQIAMQQGVRPRPFSELLGPDPTEPADDDVDEFLNELYEWRRNQSLRSLD